MRIGSFTSLLALLLAAGLSPAQVSAPPSSTGSPETAPPAPLPGAGRPSQAFARGDYQTAPPAKPADQGPKTDRRLDAVARGDYTTTPPALPAPLGPAQPLVHGHPGAHGPVPNAAIHGQPGALGPVPNPQVQIPQPVTPGTVDPDGRTVHQYGQIFDAAFLYTQGPWAPGTRTWFNADYLLWWIKAGPTPSLFGTVPATTVNSLRNPMTGAVGAGTLPSGAINVTFGRPDRDLEYHVHNGGRFTGGLWLDPEQQVGIEVGYFMLERQLVQYSDVSAGVPALGPLFFNPGGGALNIYLAGVQPPGGSTAMVAADANERLWGAELNAKVDCTIFSDRTDFIVGFRHLQFSEGLALYTNSVGLPGDPLSAGFDAFSFDSFGTHNQFYGPQIGWVADRRWDDWFLGLTCKVGLGLMHQAVNVNGFTTLNSPVATTFRPAGTATFPGGVLAQPTNIGHYSRDRIAVIPEFGVTFGRQLTSNLRASLGYTFLYVSDVVRPGTQIDSFVDPRGIRALAAFDPRVRPSSPSFDFNTTDFWATGFTFGLEFRY